VLCVLLLLPLLLLALLLLPLVIRLQGCEGGRRPLLVLLLWRQCWLARRLLAAALQQLLHGISPVHPAASHPDCCMQQVPAKHPQLSGQALVAGMAICCPPGGVCVVCLRHPPQQRVFRVVYCRICNLQQHLLLALCREW
jgi:hypothetical protein